MAVHAAGASADDVARGQAEFGAQLIAESRMALETCSGFYPVSEGVLAGTIETGQSLVDRVDEVEGERLVSVEEWKIRLGVQTVGAETWCRDYRDRMIAAGGQAAFAAPAAPPAVPAQDGARYMSDRGHAFALGCNVDGQVMTRVPQGENVYLGRSCDAWSPDFGAGRWCASNGGFVVEVGPLTMVFPRQEPSCQGQPGFTCPC